MNIDTTKIQIEFLSLMAWLTGTSVPIIVNKC